MELARKAKYQLFGMLRDEEYAALEADILKRGVQVAVEKDEEGNILDGHHRLEIAETHGLDYPEVVRHFETEAEKREHVIKLNLARRHLASHEWGLAFKKLLEAKGVNRGRGQNQGEHSPTLGECSEELGVAPKTAEKRLAQADAYESLPSALRAEVDSKDKTVVQAQRAVKEQRQESRREENRKAVEQFKESPTTVVNVDLKYATIVADPPWDWGDEGDQSQLGRARVEYATVPFSDLLTFEPVEDGRKVHEFADVDCHLYLWITNRSLPKGFQLLEQWGFRYITCLTWCKPSFGMGNYFRGQTEHVLFGVRGSQSLARKDVGTVFHSPRGKDGHSSKPGAFYELVESCSPGPYLELFARNQRGGDWTCLGAEA